MITVFVMGFNEEVLMEFFISHYRSRFPGCLIYVYDNESTDDTAKIARANGCEVMPYKTDGKVNDDILRTHKNNVWKKSSTDWVLVCDMDELIDINEEQLKQEEAKGTTMIRGTAYNMVNMAETIDLRDLAAMNQGFRDWFYDKTVLWDRRQIEDVNYNYGAHQCHPEGNVCYNTTSYLLRHYKHLGADYMIHRLQYSVDRSSEFNLIRGLGPCKMQEPEVIRQGFEAARAMAKPIVG